TPPLPHRGFHPPSPAPFRPFLLAGEKLAAAARRARLPRQRLGPGAEVVAVPRRLGLERRQAEPLPDFARVLHELARRQRDRRERALERRVDQHGRGLAAVARAAWPVARVLVRHDLEIVLRLA